MNLNTRAREQANCSRNNRRIKNPAKFKFEAYSQYAYAKLVFGV